MNDSDRIRLLLFEFASDHSLDEVLTRALDDVCALVDSPIGFYHILEPDRKTISLQQWSTRTREEFCRAEGVERHYPLHQAGVWVDCVHQRQPVIHNDYASLPHKRGLPEGHADVIRELVVPVMRGGQVVAILGVGNKPTDYTDEDVATVSYLADVTWVVVGEKKAEEELRREKNRASKYLDIAGVMFVALDREGSVSLINQKGSEILGWPQQEILGRNWFDHFVPSEQRERVKAVFQQLMSGETVLLETYENRVVTRNGEDRVIAWQNTLVIGDDGAIAGTLSSGADITERRRAEQEGEKLQAQLLQAQKMESVGQLAGGVAHDFNNMLGVIQGRAELILMDMAADDPHRQDIEEIQKAAGQSASLTSQLLAFARQQNISPRVLDLNDTVECMLKMLRRLIGEDIELVWKPSGPEFWMVRMDPAQVDQILANLCVNARDAISGQGTITIETAKTRIEDEQRIHHPGLQAGEYILMAISDDGCGMDRQVQSRLFEPFFTTKEIGKGTGLGLATIYGIVKQNDGYIDVSSELGEGTTIRIYIPRYIGATGEPSAAVPAVVPQGEGETILLVEDDPSYLAMAYEMLERLGYSVLAANNVEEAIRLARDHAADIDLLMTDVIMPGLSGKALAEKITTVQPSIRVLYISGYTADVIAHHGVLEAGVHFLAKPFSLMVLGVKVRDVLEGRSLN